MDQEKPIERVPTGQKLADQLPAGTRTKRISLQDLMRMNVPTLRLSPRFHEMLGSPPRDQQFNMALVGDPGAGKSSFALQLAQEFSRFGEVEIICAEEPTKRGTIRKRARENGIYTKKLFFFDCNSLPLLMEELKDSNPKFCIIDSVNTFEEDDVEISKLPSLFPEINFIFVAQMNKDRRAIRGGYDWEHNVDIPVRCEVRENGDRFAVNIKPRMGGQTYEMFLFALPGSVPAWVSRYKMRARMNGKGAAGSTSENPPNDSDYQQRMRGMKP